MKYIQKYKSVIILILIEIIFYFRLNIIDTTTYFFTWFIIGIAFWIYNIFNIIKTNPILILFAIDLSKTNKKNNISEHLTIKEKILKPDNIIYLLFVLTNFSLYLF
jgi:hypothetical protein